MSSEIPKEIYSLHRYVDNDGAPDEERIFSVAEEGSWRRHLNSDLMEIIKNQPDKVKDLARNHLQKCKTCKEKYFPKEPEQQLLKEQ